ncbi:hypothetical protein EDB87DRAFT_1703907, partial [Lactarius vividus]
SSSAAKRPRSRSDFTPDDWRRRNIPRSDAIPTKKHRSVQRQTPHDIQAPRTWGNAGRTRRVQTSTRMEMRTRPKESTDLPVNIKNFPKRSTTRPERAGPLTDLLAMTVRGGPTREGTVVCRPAKTQITPRNVQHQASVLGSSSDSSTIPKSCYMLNASPVESGLGTSIRKEVNDPLVGQKNAQQKDQDSRHVRNVDRYGTHLETQTGVEQDKDPRLPDVIAAYPELGTDESVRLKENDTTNMADQSMPSITRSSKRKVHLPSRNQLKRFILQERLYRVYHRRAGPKRAIDKRQQRMHGKIRSSHRLKTRRITPVKQRHIANKTKYATATPEINTLRQIDFPDYDDPRLPRNRKTIYLYSATSTSPNNRGTSNKTGSVHDASITVRAKVTLPDDLSAPLSLLRGWPNTTSRRIRALLVTTSTDDRHEGAGHAPLHWQERQRHITNRLRNTKTFSEITIWRRVGLPDVAASHLLRSGKGILLCLDIRTISVGSNVMNDARHVYVAPTFAETALIPVISSTLSWMFALHAAWMTLVQICAPKRLSTELSTLLPLSRGWPRVTFGKILALRLRTPTVDSPEGMVDLTTTRCRGRQRPREGVKTIQNPRYPSSAPYFSTPNHLPLIRFLRYRNLRSDWTRRSIHEDRRNRTRTARTPNPIETMYLYASKRTFLKRSLENMKGFQKELSSARKRRKDLKQLKHDHRTILGRTLPTPRQRLRFSLARTRSLGSVRRPKVYKAPSPRQTRHTPATIRMSSPLPHIDSQKQKGKLSDALIAPVTEQPPAINETTDEKRSTDNSKPPSSTTTASQKSNPSLQQYAYALPGAMRPSLIRRRFTFIVT